PLVYEGVLRVAAVPSVATSALLAAVLTMGALGSYYLAAMLGLVLAAATVIELPPTNALRRRFVVDVACAAALAYGILFAVSQPYFGRADAATIAADADTLAELLRLTVGNQGLAFGRLEP